MVDRVSIFLEDFISKGWLPGPWERHCCVLKLAGGWEIYISKGQRKKNYNFNFPKVITLSKGMSGVYSQKEICLKCSEAEGVAFF